MKILRYITLIGLVGLLTGCLTPEEMGYLAPSEPIYVTPGAAPVATPVYNTSPAYYATPVSGYSTMTVYDGYHPGYGGPRYQHHREPPRGRRPGAHGGYGEHGGHGGRPMPARAAGRMGETNSTVRPTGARTVAGGRQPARVTQSHSAAQKPLPGKDLSGKGSKWKSGTSGKGGTSGKISIRGKGSLRKK